MMTWIKTAQKKNKKVGYAKNLTGRHGEREED